MSRKCHALIVEQIDPAGVDNSPFGQFDLFAVPSANDGVDGAPNVISMPRCSLSTTHLKESRPWAGLSGIWPLYARWARSGEEGLSGSRRRRQHRSSGPDRSLSQDAGRADPGARRPDAAQGGQDCERPEEGDRVAEDAGEPISAAASRGSDGRLRLHVAVARTWRWRRAAVTGSRRGVRQCGKARRLRQRMANAPPSPWAKITWPILVVRESLTAR